MIRFEVGDRVVIPAFEDQPEEYGAVIEVESSDMYIVYVDRALGEYHDRIREVHASNMGYEYEA